MQVIWWERRFRRILDAFGDRDFDRAFEAQAFVTDVALDLFTLPNPIRLKAALTELGLPVGPTRPPLQTIDPLDVTDLVKRLREKSSKPESLGGLMSNLGQIEGLD